jgi:hypothetical protein
MLLLFMFIWGTALWSQKVIIIILHHRLEAINDAITGTKWPQATKETVPSPKELSTYKTVHFHMLAGGLGEYLVRLSGCAQPQAEVLMGLCRVCGMMVKRQFTTVERANDLAYTARVVAMAEARLPIWTSNAVRHVVLHFFDEGGWVDLMGPARSLQK